MIRPGAIWAGVALALAGVSAPSDAGAVELMPTLSCALTKTTHVGADYCLEVFNTCNTQIVSRIQDRSGAQTDSSDIPSGERGKVCSAAPFTVLGHYITGPGSN